MIIPSSRYPAQTDIDLTNYPQGKARNVVASGDGTGTPWERDLVNDIFGFFQALALHAGITPSGSPDTAVASQLMDAVSAAKWLGVYAITAGSAVANGVNFALTQTSQYGGFSLASNQVTVPVAGKYRVSVAGKAASSDTSSNPSVVDTLLNAGAVSISVGGLRYSTVAGWTVPQSASYVFTISNPSTEKIYLAANSGAGNTTQFSGSPQLAIERVG